MKSLKNIREINQSVKQAKGITLVALIITIIVLIILAMVSIRLVINGDIINKSKYAVDEYSDEEVKEQIKLAYTEWQTSQWIEDTGDANTFITERLQSTFGESNVKNVSVTRGKVIVEIRTTGDFIKYSYNSRTGVARVVKEWKKNKDGSYSNGTTSGVKVGDKVKYETILNETENAVDSTELASLKTYLSTYSGDSSSTDNYKIDRTTSMQWKVLDIKDGKIRLISATATSKKISLNDVDGYNNAVFLIDKVCDTLYSIDGVGKAQNLKIEDIEEKLKIVDGKTARDNYVNTNVTPNLNYEGTREYTSCLQYPVIYPSEVGCKGIDGTSETDNNTGTLGLSSQTKEQLKIGSTNASSRLKVTQTYWKKLMESSDFDNSKYFNIFIRDANNHAYSAYWLSSRCVIPNSDYIGFSVYYLGSGYVNASNMFYSYGRPHGISYFFRPVVTLEDDIELSGNSTNGWTIQ